MPRLETWHASYADAACRIRGCNTPHRRRWLALWAEPWWGSTVVGWRAGHQACTRAMSSSGVSIACSPVCMFFSVKLLAAISLSPASTT